MAEGRDLPCLTVVMKPVPREEMPACVLGSKITKFYVVSYIPHSNMPLDCILGDGTDVRLELPPALPSSVDRSGESDARQQLAQA
jgi:hypothetical protein